MSETQTQTPRLGLPLLAGGQAQKHIVVNDALLNIDHLVQARLNSRSVSAQPITPRDGDIYMLPTGATGAVWSGFLAQEIVRYFDGFWYVLSHPEGTLIYVADENLYLCKSSLGWVGLDTLMRDIQNARYLGLGAIADDANPLVFKLNSALLTAKSGGEGGTGDLRLTLNREALGNTASILFKNNYVAQAEIGLLGNNNLCVKTKSEAGAWGEAIHVTPAGQIGLGTSTPAQKLEIAGSDIVVHAMTIGRGGGSQATNTAIGGNALGANTSGTQNTALGNGALLATNFSNTTGLGYGAQVTADNQVQLGNAATTTYVYGTVQNRSDARDKADIRDTVLGLDFINALHPVDYRFDLRDDYRTPPPTPPSPNDDTAAHDAYAKALAKWREDNRLSQIIRDGRHKRTRYHSGLIAQEVEAVVSGLGLSWGGVQDHSHGGGDEVMTLGYAQFIAPLIRAVQQLHAMIQQLTHQP